MRLKEPGADDRAHLQISQLTADDRIVWIGALRYGGNGETAGEFGGKVFHAVDREIDAPVEQRFFDFFGEDPLAADFVERDVQNLVAGGLDNLDPAFGAARFQTFPDVVRLPEC